MQTQMQWKIRRSYLSKKTEIIYDELVELVDKRPDNLLLVDVRDEKDLEEFGSIPGCINIPLTKLKNTLSLEPEEFLAMVKVSKPGKDNPNIIFYGHKSVKSSTALEIAHKLGFKKSRQYPGGWREWAKKQEAK